MKLFQRALKNCKFALNKMIKTKLPQFFWYRHCLQLALETYLIHKSHQSLCPVIERSPYYSFFEYQIQFREEVFEPDTLPVNQVFSTLFRNRWVEDFVLVRLL